MGALLKSQKNDVYRAIQRAGLDPSDFNWNGTDDTITYGPKKWYYCQFGSNYVHIAPGPNLPQETVRPGLMTWENRLLVVGWWISSLKSELETEDLWASLPTADAVALAAASEGADNRVLTREEQRRVAESLRELLPLAKELQLLPAQLARLEERVGYLIENSGRFGKRDFLNLVSGTLVNFFLAAAVPPEAARALFGAALKSLDWLFGHLILGSPQPLLGS